MNLSSFISLFKKSTSQTLFLSESLLVKKLKIVSKTNDFSIFENITIYHQAKNFFIPLLILSKKHGIFLFEYKAWSYDDLKNAKAQKANTQSTSNNTVAFEKSHQFIKRKFNELIHSDGIPISNYLLMQNLNLDQYRHLDSSFHELLPECRIMFNDSTESSILEKMMQNNEEIRENHDVSSAMSTLLIQYAIIDKNKNFHLASEEQMRFINAPLSSYEVLCGLSGSGKTSSILLKAILEKLKNPHFKIVIIKATNLACDILKKRLFDTLEHAIIDIDLKSIDILTPANYTYTSRCYDLIICDDAWACPRSFIHELKILPKNKHVILVTCFTSSTASFTFSKNFKNQYKNTFFYEANPYAKTLQIISTLLLTCKARDILVVGNQVDQCKLLDDLEYYIESKPTLLDGTQGLATQDLNKVLLASYNDINSMDVDFVILMDIASTNIRKIEYAFNLCHKSVYVLYKDESENLKHIRNNFENNEEQR